MGWQTRTQQARNRSMDIHVQHTHRRVDELEERLLRLEHRVAKLEKGPKGIRGWLHRLIYGRS